MKIIKISLVTAVIGLITFFVINSLTTIVAPPQPPPPVNEFTKIIDKEISALQRLSATNFTELKSSYEDVKFDIDDFYNDKRLGKNQLENNQSKERLSKNLYSIYVVKFINLSKSVFSKSDWNIKDIAFIRSESKALKNSNFLQKGNGVYTQIKQIQQVLRKFDEINSFIASCNRYSYSNNELNSVFPIDTVKQKIARAASYRRNNLENSLVNNCAILHRQLNETTNFLFNAHIRYLDKKINDWSGMYTAYNSQGEYAREFYFKIKTEINGLDNDIYRASNFDNEYDKLIYKLNLDNSNAKIYFSEP